MIYSIFIQFTIFYDVADVGDSNFWPMFELQQGAIEFESIVSPDDYIFIFFDNHLFSTQFLKKYDAFLIEYGNIFLFY